MRAAKFHRTTAAALLAFSFLTMSAPIHAMTVDELYSNRLFFDGEGRPLVTVRLMERQRQVTLTAPAGSRFALDDKAARPLPAGAQIIVERQAGAAAKVRSRWILETLEGKGRLKERREALKRWKARGVAVSTVNVGGTYGVKGTVVDNRAILVVSAQKPSAKRLAKWGVRPVEVAFLEKIPSAISRVVVDGKQVAARATVVRVVAPEGERITVADVEHSVGFAGHGRQTRTYRGEVLVAPDRAGQLAAINLIPESTLISGVVPSETFASAPLEALKAQAVTARGELFAKIGRKFFADPYVTCASQSCQVYKGAGAETERTNVAATTTEGELLFFEGELVASVYSACCGGHTEPADVVWGTPPKSALVGRADVPHADPASRVWNHPVAQASLFAQASGHPEMVLPIPVDLREEKAVREFLAADRALTFCGRSTFNQKGNSYRWTKRMTADELTAKFLDLGVGRVQKLIVVGRGPGGRLRSLEVRGDRKTVRVDRELPVRRRLAPLKSGLFVVDEERDERGALLAVTLRGAGFGHGAGMCQQGAIGMAEAGYNYREILRHYYGGAVVRKVF